MQFQPLIFFPRSTNFEVRSPSKSRDPVALELRLFHNWLPVCRPSRTVSNASAKSLSQCQKCLTPESVQRRHLYLTGSAAAFRPGSLQHFQNPFSRKARRRIPISRARLRPTEEPISSVSRVMYAVRKRFEFQVFVELTLQKETSHVDFNSH